MLVGYFPFSSAVPKQGVKKLDYLFKTFIFFRWIFPGGILNCFYHQGSEHYSKSTRRPGREKLSIQPNMKPDIFKCSKGMISNKNKVLGIFKKLPYIDIG